MSTPSPASPNRAIVVVGHVCIDENTSTEHAVADEHTAPATRRVPGSSAFFMSQHWRTVAGVDVGIVAPHGDDFLTVCGSLPLLNSAMAHDTLLYRNHLDGEERRQECFNARDARPTPLTLELAQALGRSDMVVVCPLLPGFSADYVDSVVRRTEGLRVLLAQGYWREVSADGTVGKGPFDDYGRVIPQFDLVVFSDEDVDDALAVAAGWSREFPDTAIVVTQNRHGASYFSAGGTGQVPAHRLARPGIANVVGAGDTFSAALATSYLESRDIRSAVYEANRVAAGFIDAAGLSAAALPLTA